MGKRKGEEKKQDLKKFLKVARIVLKGVVKKGSLIQQTYAENALINVNLLDGTL